MKNLLIITALLLSACGQGPQGVQGQPGTPGGLGPQLVPQPSLTAVQFCPGTPSYPSTFPEVGFVINGSIYAVYSANDGFLTLLLPGYYASNAIGSSCNFTINADGTISH